MKMWFLLKNYLAFSEGDKKKKIHFPVFSVQSLTAQVPVFFKQSLVNILAALK